MKQIFTMILIGMTILFIFNQLFSQSEPDFRLRRYDPEMWRSGSGRTFQDDKIPTSGLSAAIGYDSNEPLFGYPFSSGRIIGVSDTVLVRIGFRNHMSSSYDITSATPQNWFTPKVWDVSANPRKNHPVADESDFNFEFQYWGRSFRVITQPDSIIKMWEKGSNNYMVFHLWGLPAGRYRIYIEKTEYAPTEVATPILSAYPLWISKPVRLADTLNAYAACYHRASWREDYSSALSWTDSILAVNPNSITGYFFKASAYKSLLDTTNREVALDSVIAICERYGDPAMPADSSKMGKYWDTWFQDLYQKANFYKWEIETGNYNTGPRL